MLNLKFLALPVVFVISATGLLIPLEAQAKPNQASQQPHYCGTKLTGRLISDRTFGPACKIHDECLESGTDRNICRKKFKNAMLDICNNLPDGKETKIRFFTNGDRKRACLAKAYIYATGVGLNDLRVED